MARPAFAPELHHDQLQFADATAQGRAPVFLPSIQRVRFNRAVQRRHEAIPVDRLLDEVVRAAAQAAQREVVLAVACDHQRGRVGPAPQDLGQERETVHARHPDIGDDRVVVPGADPLERRRRRVGRVHRNPIHSEPERLGKRLQKSRIVVDDENVRRCHGAEDSLSAGKGNWMRDVAPSPGVLATEIAPPCSLTIPYVMDKPRPVPFPTSLVVKNGSKIRCSSPGGIPCPVSTNAISTVAEPTEAEMRIALRGESSTASRAFANRLMNTCSSWMGLPTTTGSSGPRSSVTSISCSRSCSCTRDSARSITGLREIGSRLTGAARPNVRRCELICVAFDTCCMAWRSSRTFCPLSAPPSSMRSIALPTNKSVLLRVLLCSWATPVVSSPSVASLPAWTSCSCLSRSSCSRRCISAVVSRRSPMMWIIAFRLSSRRRLDRWESLCMCRRARRELSRLSVWRASPLRSFS